MGNLDYRMSELELLLAISLATSAVRATMCFSYAVACCRLVDLLAKPLIETSTSNHDRSRGKSYKRATLSNARLLKGARPKHKAHDMIQLILQGSRMVETKVACSLRRPVHLKYDRLEQRQTI